MMQNGRITSLVRPPPREVLVSSASRGLAPHEGPGLLLLKLGRTGPLTEPHRGPQAGKSGHPRSQDADSSPRAQGTLELGFEAKPKGKCRVSRAPTAYDPVDAWRLTGCGRLRFPMLPRQPSLPD